MPATIVTPEDLQNLKKELIEEIEKLRAKRASMPIKKWLKSHEVRKMLSISPGTLQNLRINGMLPFTKIGGVIFYEYEDVKKMLEDHKHVSYSNSFHR